MKTADGAAAGGKEGYMDIRCIMLPRLDLFDGEGGAAAATPADGAGEAKPAAPAVPGRKADKFANVIFGKQTQADQKAQEQTETTEGESAAAKLKRFQDMINGEFKDEFAREFNEKFNRRWEGMKGVKQRAEQAEARLQEMQNVVDLLNERYNISDGKLESLQHAIEEDIDMWNKAGAPEGLTGEQKRAQTMTNMKLHRLENAAKARLGQERAERQISQWREEAVQMIEKYPGFDLKRETDNPEFVGLLRAHVPMEHAYKVIHLDEIVADAVSTTQSTVEKRVVDSVRARGARPAENGTAAQNAAVIKSNVSKLTREERAEIAKRVMRGEHIEF